MAVCAQYLFNSCGFVSSDLTTLRLFGSGVCLLLLYAISTKSNIFAPFKDFRNLRDVVVYGIGVLLIQWTFFKAISVSNAGTAAIMVGFGPLFIIFYFVLTKGRKTEPQRNYLLSISVGRCFSSCFKREFSNFLTCLGQVCFGGLASAAFGAFCTVQPKQVIERAGVSFCCRLGNANRWFNCYVFYLSVQ